MRHAGMRSVVLSCACVLALAASGAAQADRFVGSWVSENGKFMNVTTMHADGRFKTERLEGLTILGTVEGRWQVRGEAIAWTYLVPRADGEDVNAIVSATKDRFTLREADGTTSTFFRKGVVDPLSPSLLPVAVGTGWVLQDEMGEMAVRIGVRETVAGQDCYRVDWIDGTINMTYQSEYWALRDDGVYAVGRRVLGRNLMFEQPYRVVSRTPAAGEKWQATVKAPGLNETFAISVGAEEEVTTPAGTFRAMLVTVQGAEMGYRRWYAPGVGLVREQSLVLDTPHNVKALTRRIQ